MNAAQLDRQPEQEVDGAEEPFALKAQVAQRLAEHRARRAGGTAAAPTAERVRPARGRSAEIAAAVAKRYEHSPSYRAVLAEEAARATRQAEAAAEVANINARAIARAQQQLLADLGEWDEPQEPVDSVSLKGMLPGAHPGAAAAVILAQRSAAAGRTTAAPATPAAAPAAVALAEPVAEVSRSGYTVRLYEDTGRSGAAAAPPSARREALAAATDLDEQEAMLLDEEIAFRQDPTFQESRGPEPIAANLIEFPRQLVAARKARPRLAEGPLREDGPAETGQLRIFEVEAEHISAAPAAEEQAPEWTSILLPAQPVSTFFEPLDTDYVPAMVPQTAALNRRAMAAVVDGCLVGVCILSGVALFTTTVTHLTHMPLTMPLPVAAGALLAITALFAALYHLLFFTFSDATPGMRYARIALCTLSDENPSRAAMRMRLLAMTLSALPLGMGYVWAVLDEDRLGWHDRISRMYQRSY